jgi:VWFA-related protein
LLGVVAGPAASGADAPKKLDLKDSVQVSLVALEVTVWPKQLDSHACEGLTIDDFELLVDGKPQQIYAVDSLGTTDDVYKTGAFRAGEPSAGGMSFVLFFDLWHLDLMYRVYGACPATKALAFAEARRFVQEEFKDGDRLLLVTAAGWPVVHYGWIQTQADALAALGRLEKSRQVVMPRQEHLHHNGWIAGIESLFLALGRYPGRKDVIYLADDFRFDDVAMRMYEIAARAQANGVVVNAVDLLDSCRRIDGPPCVKTDGGGLSCTMFEQPVALTPLSLDTGGKLFRMDSIASAVHELRTARKCRYLVTFRKDAGKGKHAPSIHLTLRGERQKELTLLAPSSYETAANAPTQADNDQALFLLPQFGRGLAAEVALWPYRPTAKGRRWKVFVLAHVDRTDEDAWPDDVTELKVNVLLHKQSTTYGQYTKTIAGDELKAFRERGGTGSLLFPLDRIPPGNTTVDLTVTGNVEDLSANVSKSFDIPKPPGPGEVRPWFLSDHLERMGENAVLAPSFDNVVTPGKFVAFMGYGCVSKGGAPESYTGWLVPFAGGPPVALPLRWLKNPDAPRPSCGWLAGKIDASLPPGLWTFQPPNDLGNQGGTSNVEFTVVSPIAPEGVLPTGMKSD